MELLGIGAFAKASRLSPKALRLYDALGLLTPAEVDPATGYRRYAPAQLEQARMVAWLRRLGMPLARIRQVCALEAAPAAREIRAYWARVEADTAARRDLAAFLVDHLSRKDPAMTHHPATDTPGLALRYAALSDRGLVRETNQDTAYAGDRLLAVADGFGGRGERAGAVAVEALRRLESGDVPADGLLNVLQDAYELAEHAVHGVGGATGTTLTALLLTGSQLALVHVGDSRVYLLRGGELFRITHDHTLVQSLIDEGRLTEEEAVSHPQRSLLVRALGEGADGTPELRLHDAHPGDRYLLCSDGLSAVVPDDDVRRVLSGGTEPAPAVEELISLANGRGGPDNVSCVVADVVERGR
ncbi:MerR family transcriptional regulator [Streptomyces sp. NPDC048182]|uniref:MerR family transcriptional regulator n=1 Tax=Streptomyces sp. NPDC048182 TaxID=3365507 RepID=UPI0037128223